MGGGNLQKTCLCFKRMRDDTLKRHMKTHEKKPNSIDQVTEYNSTIDGIALENQIVNQYQRKL